MQGQFNTQLLLVQHQSQEAPPSGNPQESLEVEKSEEEGYHVIPPDGSDQKHGPLKNQRVYLNKTMAASKQREYLEENHGDAKSRFDHEGQRQAQRRALSHDVILDSSSAQIVRDSPRLFGSDKTSEVRQVVFVKVHKAASSTMQNILLRFAMSRNLSVLLPRQPTRTSLNEITPILNRNMVIQQPPGRNFDILCNHVIYNKKQISKYIPPSSVRVAILRQPLKQTLSALEYYTKYYPYGGIRNGFNRYKDDPINGFLHHPEQFYVSKNKTLPTYCFINNRMSMDLGFDTTNFEQSKRNKTKIRRFIKSLENDFDLMLISDCFEESLILLRRYLSWSWRDIIYVKLNVAKHSPDSVWAKRPVMDSTAQQAFLQWNIIDIELYDHFFPLFLKKIKSEHMFTEEVTAFKQLLKRVSAFCADKSLTESLKVEKNVWSAEFAVSKTDCELMSMKESTIVGVVRNRQLKRFGKHIDGA